MKHILRYGTNADQKYFSGDLENCYDVVAINASMAAFSPDALALFVAKKTPDKEFFLDPMTHLFQHNKGFISSERKKAEKDNSTRIKSSVAKLINEYAKEIEGAELVDVKDDEEAKLNKANKNYDLIKSAVKNNPPEKNFFKSFTEGVLNFQNNIVPSDKADDYRAYINFANETGTDGFMLQDKPMFVVAPYFYLQSRDSWLSKNMTLIDVSAEVEEAKDIYAQVVIDKRLMDKAVIDDTYQDLDQIFEEYGKKEVGGYLVWIDSYSEHEELSKSLIKYAELLNKLHGENKETIALYGGYFSIVLGHSDVDILNGVAHGLEYGESRPLVPVGGGIPRAKFYLPAIHRRVDFPDMVEVLKEKNINSKKKYHEEICACDTCKEVIKSDNVLDEFTAAYGLIKYTTVKRGDRIVTMSFSAKETKDLSLKHYLAIKKVEFDSLRKKKIDEIIKEWEVTLSVYGDVLDSHYLSHLGEWTEAIKKLKKPVTKS